MEKRKGGIRQGWLEEEVKVIEEGKGNLRGWEQIWGPQAGVPSMQPLEVSSLHPRASASGQKSNQIPAVSTVPPPPLSPCWL